jgi:hypothetical protein
MTTSSLPGAAPPARAGLHSAAEPHLGLTRREREAQRGVESRGDFTTPMSSGVVVGDVSIVHPAAPSFVVAATTTSAAARNRDAFKRAHYARRGPGGGYELVPVSVESFGLLGAPANALPCRVADWPRTAAASLRQRSSGARRKMGVALAKGNRRVQRAHLSRVAQAGGRVYLRGCQCRWLRWSVWKASGVGWLYVESAVSASWSHLSSLGRTCVRVWLGT